MAKQEAGNNGAAEYVARPDPLQLALEAISDAERVQPPAPHGYVVLVQRAHLRALYAIAEELRLFRLEQRGAAAWFAQIELRLVDIEEALREGVSLSNRPDVSLSNVSEVADGDDE